MVVGYLRAFLFAYILLNSADVTYLFWMYFYSWGSLKGKGAPFNFSTIE